MKDYKKRYIYTKEAPLEIVSQMVQCCDAECPGSHHLFVAEEEQSIAPPWWILGWDVFVYIGHHRFRHHFSVSEIREQLVDEFNILLSEDAIEDYIGRYQTIVAARQRDLERLKEAYKDIDEVWLTIDGLQPEKGHETLYTVRELKLKRVWFAVPILSASKDEIRRRLLEKAREWTEAIGKSVGVWMSDKEKAFATGIAEVFPETPHRYCQNHFIRDLAKPVLEIDSQAKVAMRGKVRNLRRVEREILKRQAATGVKFSPLSECILEYSAVIRGVLNKNQGGPLDPPGLKMANKLKTIQNSLKKSAQNADGEFKQSIDQLSNCIEHGLKEVAGIFEKIEDYVKIIHAVDNVLSPTTGSIEERQQRFYKIVSSLEGSGDPVHVKMMGLMKRFEPGLFVGSEELQHLRDNLDLERWFCIPKAHKRKIHGRKHAGSQLVHEGPSLVLVLDAHQKHRHPFTEQDLHSYLDAEPTLAEKESIERRRVMRRTSAAKLDKLLKTLEDRFWLERARLQADPM